MDGGSVEDLAPEDVFAFGYHVVDIFLDQALDVASEFLHEAGVFGVGRLETLERDNGQHPDVPFRG